MAHEDDPIPEEDVYFSNDLDQLPYQSIENPSGLHPLLRCDGEEKVESSQRW